MGLVTGHGFDAVSAPVVSNGAYSSGDIVGGLLTFYCGQDANSTVLITGVIVAVKAAVTSSLKLVLFNAVLSASTTVTDNAAYSLAAADVFKVVGVIDFTAQTAVLTDHGTPNTYQANCNIVCNTERGSQIIYGLLIDGTGWTLTSTADLQVRLVGVGT